MTSIQCSGCNKRFRLKPQHVGKTLTCPKCKTKIFVPAERQLPAETASSKRKINPKPHNDKDKQPSQNQDEVESRSGQKAIVWSIAGFGGLAIAVGLVWFVFLTDSTNPDRSPNGNDLASAAENIEILPWQTDLSEFQTLIDREKRAPQNWIEWEVTFQGIDDEGRIEVEPKPKGLAEIVAAFPEEWEHVDPGTTVTIRGQLLWEVVSKADFGIAVTPGDTPEELSKRAESLKHQVVSEYGKIERAKIMKPGDHAFPYYIATERLADSLLFVVWNHGDNRDTPLPDPLPPVSVLQSILTSSEYRFVFPMRQDGTILWSGHTRILMEREYKVGALRLLHAHGKDACGAISAIEQFAVPPYSPPQREHVKDKFRKSPYDPVRTLSYEMLGQCLGVNDADPELGQAAALPEVMPDITKLLECAAFGPPRTARGAVACVMELGKRDRAMYRYVFWIADPANPPSCVLPDSFDVTVIRQFLKGVTSVSNNDEARYLRGAIWMCGVLGQEHWELAEVLNEKRDQMVENPTKGITIENVKERNYLSNGFDVILEMAIKKIQPPSPTDVTRKWINKQTGKTVEGVISRIGISLTYEEFVERRKKLRPDDILAIIVRAEKDRKQAMKIDRVALSKEDLDFAVYAANYKAYYFPNSDSNLQVGFTREK